MKFFLTKSFRRNRNRKSSLNSSDDDQTDRYFLRKRKSTESRRNRTLIFIENGTICLRRSLFDSRVRLFFISFVFVYLSLISIRWSIFYPTEIIESRHFLLLVSHPDDESLFFNPILSNLIDEKHRGHLIVFSEGNFEGLGRIRREELNRSCRIFSLPSTRCFVVNSTRFIDDPNEFWDEKHLSIEIDRFVRLFDIDLIISFDRQGVSGHRNHRSIYFALQFYRNHFLTTNSTTKSILIYQLKSERILGKFLSIFNLIPKIFELVSRRWTRISPKDLLVVNSPRQVIRGFRSFYSHRSQNKWFRHLYTCFSQYMFINHLQPMSNQTN